MKAKIMVKIAILEFVKHNKKCKEEDIVNFIFLLAKRINVLFRFVKTIDNKLESEEINDLLFELFAEGYIGFNDFYYYLKDKGKEYLIESKIFIFDKNVKEFEIINEMIKKIKNVDSLKEMVLNDNEFKQMLRKNYYVIQ